MMKSIVIAVFVLIVGLLGLNIVNSIDQAVQNRDAQFDKILGSR